MSLRFDGDLAAARASQNASAGIHFLTTSELRQRTPPRPDWIWDDYIAAGWLTIIAGKPKVGKSTLVYSLVEAVATQLISSFLGRTVLGGPVVVISEEHATTALAKLPDSEDIRILTRDGAWPKPSWEELIPTAVAEAKRIGAVMLLVDSFTFWAQLAAEASKDPGAVQRALEPLTEATAAGLAVPLIHHHRKAGGDDGDAILGSVAFSANADAILEVERIEDADARHRRLVAVSRWPETPPVLVYDYDPRDASWRVIGEGDGRHEAGGIAWREKLFDALPAHEPGKTFDELGERFNVDKRKWAPTLAKMVDNHVIETSGKGVKGDPKRFWRASADSVQGFRTDGGTEWDGNGSGLAISIPSVPVGVRNEIASPNGNGFHSVQGRERNNDRTVADLSDDELRAVFPSAQVRTVNDEGGEMAF